MLFLVRTQLVQKKTAASTERSRTADMLSIDTCMVLNFKMASSSLVK